MSEKLLVRPDPFQDESFIGYIIRLTEVNGYNSPNSILNYLQIPIFLSHNKSRIQEHFNKIDHKILHRLSEFVEKEPDKILNLISSDYMGKNSQTSIAKLNPKVIHCFPHKFCPLCLSDFAYHRKIWDLIIITACPLHKCQLVSFCPGCNNPLSMARSYVCICKCGVDFRNISPKYIADSRIRIAGHIYLYLGLLSSKHQFIPIENLLINYSLKEFCEILYFFVKRILRLRSNKTLHFTKLSSQKTLHLAVCKTLELFDNFPSNYLIFIERIAGRERYFTDELSYKYFSAYHSDFYNTIPSSLATFLYKVFNENINEILVKKGREPSQVNYETSMSGSELAGQLGITVEEVIALASKNDIPTDKNFAQNKALRYKFDGDTFFKLMSKIRANQENQINYKGEELINLNQISQSLFKQGIRLHQFLSLVLKGRIRFCLEDIDAQGLHRFLFSEKDVKKLVF